MKAEFICHPDFADVIPLDVFHKEETAVQLPPHPPALQNRHILFRKKCILPKGRALLRISADDHYKLWINGRFVAEGPAPSYPQFYYDQTLDVSSYIREGENTFAVHAYYQGLTNRAFGSGDLRAMFWCSLETDGREVLVSDTTWKCRNHTGYSECGKFGYDTAFAEHYDSRSPEEGFFLPEYDDGTWANAAIFKNADTVLTEQPTLPLTYEEIPPVIEEKRGNTVFLDFGREAVGYLSAEAKGKRGDTILLHFGEECNPDGSVRFQLRCNCRYEEKWTLSGGRDTLYEYDYKAFRYAEIILPEGTELSSVKLIARYYPCAEKAVYPTDNPRLTEILRLCADTVKYGTQEVYVDCPTREKGQYLGDVSVSARAQATLTRDTAMMKKAIMEFCRSSFICPGIMAVAPGSLMQEIADYSLQFPAQICWIYAMDGDKEFLKKTEPYVTAELQYFRRYMREDGLIEKVSDKWNLVDWPDNLRDGYDFPLTKPIGGGVHNVLNAFWYGFLLAVDELYEHLGMPKTGLAEKVKKAYCAAFYRPKLGLFADSPATDHCAVHSNLLPLLFGVCDGDKPLQDRIAALLCEKGLSSMGVYMAYFALAALVKNGYREEAVRLATAPDAWENMLKEGATTTFEAWGKDQKWNTSLFHPWATAPLIVFAENQRIY